MAHPTSLLRVVLSRSALPRPALRSFALPSCPFSASLWPRADNPSSSKPSRPEPEDPFDFANPASWTESTGPSMPTKRPDLGTFKPYNLDLFAPRRKKHLSEDIPERPRTVATQDQLWTLASKPLAAPHSGPLTVSSSRQAPTLRTDPRDWMAVSPSPHQVESAYYRLGGVIKRAGMRREFMLRRRFERPAAKRMRRAHERRNNRFLAEVGRRVRIVQMMRFRGL